MTDFDEALSALRLSARMDIHANEEEYSMRELRARIDSLETNQENLVAALAKLTENVGVLIDRVAVISTPLTGHPGRVK